MTDRYENIRKALAMGPTPGPWEPVTVRPYSDLPYLVLGAGASDAKSAEWVPLYVHVGGRSGWMEQKANTLLIAACDPDTIRSLLEELDALQAENKRLKAERDDLEQFRVLAQGAMDTLTQNKTFPADVAAAVGHMRRLLALIDGQGKPSSSISPKEQFERWYGSCDARFWNSWDACYSAFLAGRQSAQPTKGEGVRDEA